MLAIMLLLFVPVYGVQLLPNEFRVQIARILAAGGKVRLALVIIVLLTLVDLIQIERESWGPRAP